MQTGFVSNAFRKAGPNSGPHGYWPFAGLTGTAYRLANFRVSRLVALFGASILFYLV